MLHELLASRSTATDTDKYLASHRLFSALPPNMLDTLASVATQRQYPKKQKLFYSGDPASQVFVIRTGLVALTEVDRQGTTHVMMTAAAGDVLGVGHLILGPRWAWAGTAMIDSEVIVVDKSVVDHVYNECPQLAYRVAGELLRLLRRTRRLAARRASMSALCRVAAFLLDCAGEDEGNDVPLLELDLELSHAELALLLGISRETVTRALAKLARMGLISTELKHLHVVRPQALRALIEA